jgi:ketosteroid isomerase-like protein
MADSKVELVKRLFTAFGVRDVDAMLALLDPEFEYLAPDTAKRVGRARPYKGLVGAREYLSDISAVWGEMRVVSLEYETVKNGVLVQGRVVTRDKRGGLADAPAAWLVAVRDSNIVRMTAFRDLKKAVQAGTGEA